MLLRLFVSVCRYVPYSWYRAALDTIAHYLFVLSCYMDDIAGAWVAQIEAENHYYYETVVAPNYEEHVANQEGG